jgi:hypothetical protein
MSAPSPRGHHDDRHFSPSPPPRHLRHRGGGRSIVVEHVIEKSSTSIVYPTLMRSNYTKWTLVMKVNLQAAGLWEVIHTGDGDYCEDKSALTANLRAMPLEMQVRLAVKPMAREAWEVIHNVRVSVDCVKEANVDRLR